MKYSITVGYVMGQIGVLGLVIMSLFPLHNRNVKNRHSLGKHQEEQFYPIADVILGSDI